MSLLLEPSQEQIKEEKLYQQMGVSDDEFAMIESILGRLPNYTEIGIFSVMWSEHCSYKNSKPILKKFPTKGERVLQGPGKAQESSISATIRRLSSKSNRITIRQRLSLIRELQRVWAASSATSFQWARVPSLF